MTFKSTNGNAVNIEQQVLNLLSSSRWLDCVQALVSEHRQHEQHVNITHSQGSDMQWIRGRTAAQAYSIANVHLHEPQQEWRAILQLKTGPGIHHTASTNNHGQDAACNITVSDVKTAHRRLAALIHPDKCSLPHAKEAFNILTQARDGLIQQLAPEFDLSGNALDSVGVAGGDDDDAREEGYRWWDAWEVPVSKVQAPLHAVGSTVPTQEDEDVQLWTMDLQDLKQLVSDCQANVLKPSAGGINELRSRQRKLRCARSVLSARLDGQPIPEHVVVKQAQSQAASLAACASGAAVPMNDEPINSITVPPDCVATCTNPSERDCHTAAEHGRPYSTAGGFFASQVEDVGPDKEVKRQRTC